MDEEITEKPLKRNMTIVFPGEILGVKYKTEFSVIYLQGGLFYIEYPKEIEITDMGDVILDEDELSSLKANLYKQVIEELKKAPYYTTKFFGLTYIPNKEFDPDFDPDNNPFNDEDKIF